MCLCVCVGGVPPNGERKQTTSVPLQHGFGFGFGFGFGAGLFGFAFGALSVGFVLHHFALGQDRAELILPTFRLWLLGEAES